MKKLIATSSIVTASLYAGSALAQIKPPTQVSEPGVLALMGIGLAVVVARMLKK